MPASPPAGAISAAGARPGARSWQVDATNDFAALRGDWQTLQDAVSHPFATWEWQSTWWRHLGRRRGQARLVTLRGGDGHVDAIVPLWLDTLGPLRRVRWIGSGQTDLLGPVCRSGAETAAGELLQLTLARLEDWDLFVGEQMPTESGFGAAARTRVLRVEQCPVLHCADQTWPDYLATRSKNFRDQLGRKRRQLERDHRLRMRLADDPDRLPQDIDTLIRLHRARWGSVGAFADPVAAFHHEFALLALDRGWLRLWLMEVDGAAVAAVYNLRFAGHEWYYQLGRDPRYERESVGLVALAHTVRDAVEAGVASYQFLRGDHGFKRRFTDDGRRLETACRGRGVAGRAAAAAMVHRGVLPPGVRRRLSRVAATADLQ